MIMRSILIVVVIILAAVFSLGGLLWIMARERALNAKAVIEALNFEEKPAKEPPAILTVQSED